MMQTQARGNGEKGLNSGQSLKIEPKGFLAEWIKDMRERRE